MAFTLPYIKDDKLTKIYIYMKNARRITFEESKTTVHPYTNLPVKSTRCLTHEYELREDGFGHKFHQCKKCSKMK